MRSRRGRRAIGGKAPSCGHFSRVHVCAARYWIAAGTGAGSAVNGAPMRSSASITRSYSTSGRSIRRTKSFGRFW